MAACGTTAYNAAMKRFVEDQAVMAKRAKFERLVHSWGSATPYEDCHCYGKPGLFRKSRPIQSKIRWHRAIERHERRMANKRTRTEGRRLSREAA